MADSSIGGFEIGVSAIGRTTDDYTSLVTSEHSSKPNFIAMLQAIIQPMIDALTLTDGYPSYIDLDTAIGAQLDMVGQWIGLSRLLESPISGVYFALDDATVGLDQGIWYSPPLTPAEGLISLDDETYRTFLRIKIAANNWDGSLEQAQIILGSIFANSPGTLFFVVDNFDMSMTFALAGIIPSTLLVQLLKDNYITLRPAAVLSNTIVTSVSGSPIFGLDTENAYVSGLDVGAWGTLL